MKISAVYLRHTESSRAIKVKYLRFPHVRPTGIRGDHASPQQSEAYFLVNISHMTSKRDSKLFKQLLRELPYNGILILCMLMESLLILYHQKYFRKSTSSDLLVSSMLIYLT